MRVDELAGRIGAEVAGDGAVEVTGVATLDSAGPTQLSFLHNPKYADQLTTTRAAAVIVAPRVNADGRTLLKAANPYLAYARAIETLHGHRRHPFAGVHPAAYVDPTATVGDGTVVYPGAFVGPRATVGRDCILYPNACVYDDCVLGDRVILHAGAAVGVDGFGYALDGAAHYKIPHIGNAVLEDDVEVGANTSIGRAALGSTVIGKGTKVDALVAVGHNVRTGPHCLLVAQVGIAGSTTLGHHVTMAGQVGVAGHLKIGDAAMIGAQSGVMTDLEPKQTVVGSPAMPAMHARRVYSAFTDLPALVDRIKKLEQRLAELESAGQAEPKPAE